MNTIYAIHQSIIDIIQIYANKSLQTKNYLFSIRLCTKTETLQKQLHKKCKYECTVYAIP